MDAREKQLDQLKIAFKYLNKGMIWMWRLGLGGYINAAPETIGRIMVLIHKGRKSGLTRQTPVNYTIINDAIYCTAGFGSNSHWYKNITTDPRVEVWLPDGWWAGVAEEVSDHPDRAEILREVLIASGFAASAFDDLQPKTMDTDALERLFTERDYRLIHIRRTEARTGPGGPGEHAAVWPLIAFGALLLWARSCRRTTKRKRETSIE
jgi:deazaflavin-dependent oxidoreductase (nitroreductase family)